eukprot:2864368-Rhodomonas_salina.1
MEVEWERKRKGRSEGSAWLEPDPELVRRPIGPILSRPEVMCRKQRATIGDGGRRERPVARKGLGEGSGGRTLRGSARGSHALACTLPLLPALWFLFAHLRRRPRC